MAASSQPPSQQQSRPQQQSPRPYSPLQDLDLTPKFLEDTLRAGLFPEARDEATRRIRRGLLSSVMLRCEQVEGLTRPSTCAGSSIARVERVEPKLTPVYEWWESASEEVSLMRAEKWTFSRCGQSRQSYRVHYFKAEDAFWVKVLPCTPSGVFTVGFVAVREWLSNAFAV